MAKIPEHIIDRIRDSVDIVELISRYVPLKKQGKNYKARCPFHTEKTPSFTVSSQKQIFYCFGCGEGGNAINFLMRHEKMSFIEAIKKLAEETGIKLPSYREDEQKTSEYDQLFRANQFAVEFFHQSLKNNYAQIEDYLEHRGISPKTIEEFRIGYVPDRWDSLFTEIQKKKMQLSPFLKTGLIMSGEKDPTRKYDRFRNRLIFPIRNVAGRTVGFGGRTFSEDPRSPKYLNSPESPIYIKSEILYGLDVSKEWIRKEGKAIFVEGYMDFLQLWQNGIRNLVATSGTALTEEQARLIRRYTSDVILCYDADEAGKKAAERGGQVLFQQDLNVSVVLLPSGEDPDSFVRKNGSSGFFVLLEDAGDYFDFKVDMLIDRYGTGNVSRRSKIVSELLETLAAHRDVLKQNFYINQIAQKFNLQEPTLLKELQKKQKVLRSRENRFTERVISTLPEKQKVLGLSGAWSAEKDILILLLNYLPEVKTVIFDILDDAEFANSAFRDIFIQIRMNQEKKKEDLIHLVLTELEDVQIRGLITADLFNEIGNPAKYMNDCIERIKTAHHQKKIEELQQKLKQTAPTDPEYKSILSEIQSHIEQKKKIREVFSQT